MRLRKTLATNYSPNYEKSKEKMQDHLRFYILDSIYSIIWCINRGEGEGEMT
jgi:hypothetical protein